jgi:hypothetical protein
MNSAFGRGFRDSAPAFPGRTRVHEEPTILGNHRVAGLGLTLNAKAAQRSEESAEPLGAAGRLKLNRPDRTPWIKPDWIRPEPPGRSWPAGTQQERRIDLDVVDAPAGQPVNLLGVQLGLGDESLGHALNARAVTPHQHPGHLAKPRL